MNIKNRLKQIGKESVQLTSLDGPYKNPLKQKATMEGKHINKLKTRRRKCKKAKKQQTQNVHSCRFDSCPCQMS